MPFVSKAPDSKGRTVHLVPPISGAPHPPFSLRLFTGAQAQDLPGQARRESALGPLTRSPVRAPARVPVPAPAQNTLAQPRSDR